MTLTHLAQSILQRQNTPRYINKNFDENGVDEVVTRNNALRTRYINRVQQKKQYNRNWYLSHRKSELERLREWRKANPEKMKAHAAAHYRKYKARIDARNKANYQKKRDDYLARNRANYHANIEANRAKNRESYYRNREKKLAREREKYHANIESNRAKNRESYHRNKDLKNATHHA